MNECPGLNKSIGRRIAKLRAKKKLTTIKLAKEVGVSQAQISRLENGKQGFRVSTLNNIAKALGTHIGYFFAEDETTTVTTSGDVASFELPPPDGPVSIPTVFPAADAEAP